MIIAESSKDVNPGNGIISQEYLLRANYEVFLAN